MDETMTTSTSSSSSSPPAPSQPDNNNDDDLFPQTSASAPNAAPRTPNPPPNEHLNASAPGELSPPRSQGHANDDQQPIFNNGANTSSRRLRSGVGSSTNGTGNRIPGITSVANATTTSGTASFVEDSREEGPGWGWKNKKAQEEMSRAWDNVVDRDFSLKEYGDIMMLANQGR